MRIITNKLVGGEQESGVFFWDRGCVDQIFVMEELAEEPYE